MTVQAVAGFDRAVTEFELVGRKLTWDGLWAGLEAELGVGVLGGDGRRRGRRAPRAGPGGRGPALVEEGVGLIVVLGMFPEDLDGVARTIPRPGSPSGSPAAPRTWRT